MFIDFTGLITKLHIKSQQISVADEGEYQFTPSNCNACFLFWHTTVDKAIVNADGSVVFHFKNGSEVEI